MISTMSQNVTTNVQIGDKTEVFYPEQELAELKKYLELHGFLREAVKATGIAEGTIKRIVEVGRGQKAKVDALKLFVNGFKQAAA
jgi:hypothetical protein